MSPSRPAFTRGASAPMDISASPINTKRRRSRRGEGERLREEILAAAEAILIETRDESALSVRAIANAVGVTPPSIYLHFADRNELLFAVCERHAANLQEALEAAAAGVGDPLERIRRRGLDVPPRLDSRAFRGRALGRHSRARPGGKRCR
jgi:AcrR family transcriptional regulator